MRENDGGGDAVSVADVKDEIFDMVQPRDPLRITLKDLVRCSVGDTIVTMLTDLSGFWAYDNRENLIAEEAREEEQEAGAGGSGGSGSGGGGSQAPIDSGQAPLDLWSSGPGPDDAPLAGGRGGMGGSGIF